MSKNTFRACMFALILLGGILVATHSSSEASSWSRLQFAASGSTVKFFDRSTGNIYVYSEVDGKIYGKYQLVELGEDLDPIK